MSKVNQNVYAKTSAKEDLVFLHVKGSAYGILIVNESEDVRIVKKGTRRDDWVTPQGTMIMYDATTFPPQLREKAKDHIPNDSDVVMKSVRGDKILQIGVNSCCHNGISDSTIALTGLETVKLNFQGLTGKGEPLLLNANYSWIAVSGGKYDNWMLKRERVPFRSGFLAADDFSDRSDLIEMATLVFASHDSGNVECGKNYALFMKAKDENGNPTAEWIRDNSADHSIGVNPDDPVLYFIITSYTGGSNVKSKSLNVRAAEELDSHLLSDDVKLVLRDPSKYYENDDVNSWWKWIAAVALAVVLVLLALKKYKK